MRILRTPESRFTDLKDYPFQSHYISINNIRLHYLDEGPSDARPVLLLHGVPAWSYLYRNIIKKIADNGNRVIVPDLIGFGKSDKPENIISHTYQSHVDWITVFLTRLDIKNIIMFGHDWGSLIGLRIASEHPELFSAIIISNGMLPTGEHKIHMSFRLWKAFARYSPFLPPDIIIGSGMFRKLDKEEKKAYRAPFPSLKYKSGIRALPALVPVSKNDPEAQANRIAWESFKKWEKPFLTIFSDADPITRGGDEYLQKMIPGASVQNNVRLNARHFIQEDRSTELADFIISLIEKNRN
jgi:haloalkane dehalogenase